ncbi:MAG: fasciclin domain-containing protein [Mariniblastus sp.]|nr:fasciclin domain-containing protein [Mariniblastus sp.]
MKIEMSGVKNVNRGKNLFCALLVVVCPLLFAVPASAHSVFKKQLAAKYPDRKISCYACHGKSKKDRNVYGRLLMSQFDSKSLTADFKSKKGADKKVFEKDVMIPEFLSAFDKVQAMTLAEAIEAAELKTLLTAAKAADLVAPLSQTDTQMTLFVPTEAAFAKLPEGTVKDLLKPENKEKLAGILMYHAVPKKVSAADVVKLKSAETAGGKSVKISVSKNSKDEDEVKLDDAMVTETDIMLKNGVIHVIDSVLLPN